MFEAALTYLKDSDDGVRTALVGGLLSLFAFLLVPILPVLGYLVRVLDRTAGGDRDAPTFDDWETLTVDGLKALAIGIAYLLIPAVVMAAFVGTGTLLAAATRFEAIGAVLVLAGSVLTMLVGLAVWYVLPAALTRFARVGSLGAAFELRAIEPVLRSGTYARGWLYALAIFVAGGIVVGLVGSVPILGWLAAPFLAFYVEVSAYYVYGQSYGEALAVERAGQTPVEGEQPVV